VFALYPLPSPRDTDYEARIHRALATAIETLDTVAPVTADAVVPVTKTPNAIAVALEPCRKRGRPRKQQSKEGFHRSLLQDRSHRCFHKSAPLI